MSGAQQTRPFDRRLVQKYDRPGPRYTSYPTAPHFSGTFSAEDYRTHLAVSRESPLPLSLYVHVPFCETRCFFCGCNVVIARDRGRAHDYLDHLEREMSMVAGRLDAGRRHVVQVHWGGGTPTFLPPEEIAALMSSLHHHFRLADDCEIGVEVDPRHCTPEQLDALVAGGVNRLSLGVQDLAPRVQQAIHRIQPPEQTEALLAAARERGIESINVDLVYGLPYQSEESFSATLDQVLEWSPDRLAVFNFAYLPSLFPHQQALSETSLPDPETKLSLLELTVEHLVAAGYVLIGMDHFARPTDPLAQALRDRSLTRNFQGYSTCGETDLVAFGVSSISQVGGGYAQNHRQLAHYLAAISRGELATFRGCSLSPEDRLRRDVILGIMSRFQLDRGEIERRYDVDVDRHFAAELAALGPLEEDGLVQRTDAGFEITPIGRLLVRNVAMLFDAYLDGSTQRYSRTV